MKRAIVFGAVIACTKPAPVAPIPQHPLPSAPLPPPPTGPQPQELAFPDDAFRTSQPAAGTPRDVTLPALQTFTLANGLVVHLVEDHRLPLVSVKLRFAGGWITDPPAKVGLATTCSNALTEGTVALDKAAYARALAVTGSTIRARANDDSIELTASTLSKHLPATLDLLAQTIRTPAFRAPDFERVVKRGLARLEQARSGSLEVGWRVHTPILFGLAHPLGRVTTEATLGALVPADCTQLVAKYFVPGGNSLIVVGDLTQAQVREDFAFATWRGKAPALRDPGAPRGPTGRLFFVHVPGATQSSVSVLFHTPRYRYGDHYARQLVSSALAGSVSSRLSKNLREDKNYAYGVWGERRASRFHGIYDITGTVRTDATYQSMLELARELKGLSIDEPELAVERTAALLALPAQFESLETTLARYEELVLEGPPLEMAYQISEVSTARANALVRGELDASKAIYLVAGDGDAKMIVRDGDKDAPMLEHGQPVTMRAALAKLGGLVEIDVDGRVKR